MLNYKVFYLTSLQGRIELSSLKGGIMFENLPIVEDRDAKFLKERMLPDLLRRVDMLLNTEDSFEEGVAELVGDLDRTNVRLAAAVHAGAQMVVQSLKADTFGELPDDVCREVGWNVAVMELAVLGLIDRALGR